jgi:hypothetical protein
MLLSRTYLGVTLLKLTDALRRTFTQDPQESKKAVQLRSIEEALNNSGTNCSEAEKKMRSTSLPRVSRS